MSVRFAWTLLCCLLTSAIASAESPRSAVLVVQGDDPLLAELTMRLTGELLAAGFRVVSARGPVESPRSAMERASAEQGSSAIILLRAEAGAVELWISDRVLGSTSNLRLNGHHPEPSERARRLSVEAVEVLRARLAELALGETRAEQAEPQGVVRPAPPARLRTQLALGGGLGLLSRRHHLRSALLPVLAADLTLAREGDALAWSVGLRAGGLGSTHARSSEQGEAELRQGFGLLLSELRLRNRSPLTPALSLGLGLYTLRVAAQAEPPYQAHGARSFSSLLSQGVALHARLTSWLSLRLTGELTQALAKSAVRIADQQVARAGGFMLSARLELLAVVW